MRYRDRLTKRIKLPSGEEVSIYKINALNSPLLERASIKEDAESQGVRLTKFILTEKVGEIDGMKIVETVKDPKTEISIAEIEQDDIDAIVGQVLEFSGLSKRAEEARKTFPETGADRGQRTPAGEGLSGETAHGVIEAPNGRMAVIA